MTSRSPIEFIVNRLDVPHSGLAPNGGSFHFNECTKEQAQYWLVFAGRPDSQLRSEPVTIYLRIWNNDSDRPATDEEILGWDHHQILLDLADWYKGQLVQNVRNITVTHMAWRLRVQDNDYGLLCDCPVRPWEVSLLNLKGWDFVIEFEDSH